MKCQLETVLQSEAKLVLIKCLHSFKTFFFTPAEAPTVVTVSRSPLGTLTQGDYMNLTCSTTDANPPAQLRWTRGHYRDIDNDPKLFHQVLEPIQKYAFTQTSV